MAIFEQNETFTHWITIRDRTGVKVDPTTIVESIYDPCNNAILTDQSMTSDSTGVYYWDEQLSSTATFGKYRVVVKTTAGAGQTSYLEDEFFIMPWKLEKDIRRTTGVDDEKSIEDDDLSHIAWKSYQQALRDVFNHHYGETPSGNPDTGVGFNGSNTCFQTSYYPIADKNGDGSVTGSDSSCGTDITGWWINSAGHRTKAIITVTEENNGEISVYQSDGATAIPSTNEGVYLDYWSEYESYDLDLFREAVVNLASHLLMQRLKEVDRVTLGDLSGNAPIVEVNSRRFWNEYKRIINLVRSPRVGVV